MQTEGLTDMDGKQLRAELDKARAELRDLEELRGGFLGQTGVHIGARVLKSARRQFEQEEGELKERIALLEKRLAEVRAALENADNQAQGLVVITP